MKSVKPVVILFLSLVLVITSFPSVVLANPAAGVSVDIREEQRVASNRTDYEIHRLVFAASAPDGFFELSTVFSYDNSIIVPVHHVNHADVPILNEGGAVTPFRSIIADTDYEPFQRTAFWGVSGGRTGFQLDVSTLLTQRPTSSALVDVFAFYFRVVGNNINILELDSFRIENAQTENIQDALRADFGILLGGAHSGFIWGSYDPLPPAHAARTVIDDAAVSLVFTNSGAETPYVILTPSTAEITAREGIGSSATINVGGTARNLISFPADNTPAWINVVSNYPMAESITVSLGAGVPSTAVFDSRTVIVYRDGATQVLTVSVNLPAVLAPPSIVSHPVNTTVVEGQNAVFTVVPSGNPTPTVHWEVSADNGFNWTNIAGAVENTLTLENVAMHMDGNLYRAIAANNVFPYTSTSNHAMLSVSDAGYITPAPPVIINHPVDTNVAEGRNAHFYITVQGHPAPTIYWQESADGGVNWTNIVGATGSMLILPNVTMYMGGNLYRAVATNNVYPFTATSYPAVLGVSAAHFISIEGGGFGHRAYPNPAGFGETVTLNAGAAPADHVFNVWTAYPASAISAINNAGSPTAASFIMVDEPVTMVASWVFLPQPIPTPQPTPQPTPAPTHDWVPPTPTPAPPPATVYANNGTATIGAWYSGERINLTITSSVVSNLVNTAFDNNVTIYLESHPAITTVVIPRAALNRFADAGVSVRFYLSHGAVALDTDALRDIAGQARGTSVSLVFEMVEHSALSPHQQSALVGEYDIYRIVIHSSSQRITDFEGLLSVTVPFGRENHAVWRLDENGERELITSQAVDEGGIITFDTNRPSVFVVGEYVAVVQPPAHAPEPTPEPAPVIMPNQTVVRLTIGNTLFAVNGIAQIGDVAPFIEHDRTMVPLRIIAEALGADVVWVDEVRTVTITTSDQSLSLVIDVPLPDGMGAPLIRHDRTFVPVRYVAEALGADVRWDAENAAVYVYQ